MAAGTVAERAGPGGPLLRRGRILKQPRRWGHGPDEAMAVPRGGVYPLRPPASRCGGARPCPGCPALSGREET